MTQRNTIYGKVVNAQILLSNLEDGFVHNKRIYSEKYWIPSQGHLLPILEQQQKWKITYRYLFVFTKE